MLVRLLKPYVKRGKNDAVDAAAICEAMSRPGMRFVPVKSADQQAVLMLHKTRELLVKQRTMSVNALRGHLAEFGIVAAKGIGHVDELLALAQADAALPQIAKSAGGRPVTILTVARPATFARRQTGRAIGREYPAEAVRFDGDPAPSASQRHQP